MKEVLTPQTVRLVSPQEIANELGISKPTFYRRFREIPKDDLGHKIGRFWSHEQAVLIKKKIISLGQMKSPGIKLVHVESN